VGAFWFIAGMLTMLAVLVVLLPWLRTIPRFESLPALPWPVPLAGIAVIAAALAMYRWIGSPELSARSSPPISPDVVSAMNGTAPGAPSTNAAGSISAAIASLQVKLAKGSGSADEWELLAKSYEFIGKPDDARKARAHQLPNTSQDAAPPSAATAPAAPLTPDSLKLLAKAARERHEKHYAVAAEIYKGLAATGQMNADAWADYADTAATLNGNKLAGTPESYIANALTRDPNHAKALWLKASADEEAGRYADAVMVWRQLQVALPPDSQDAKIVAANLQQDSTLASSTGTSTVTGTSAPAGSGAATGTRISGEVSISGPLSAKAQPGATLFIVAKSVDLPGPPVAVFRGSVGGWPVKFMLDDSSSMLPGRNLSSAKRITVEARISQSGQAQPAAGDLRGITGVIDPSSHQLLKIVIDQVVS
jgi:cytochrome c-type biogenesis protein CcmH/NrfG